MSKKVLILQGSPRKNGNCDILCEQFAKGAKEVGHQVEIVRVAEKKIGYCMACNACKVNGGACVQKDDMAELRDKMAACDVLVLASPVYYYSISAQIKTVIDRCYVKYDDFAGKEMYYILTSAVKDAEKQMRSVECFRGFRDCIDGAVEKGIIHGVGVWEKGDVKAAAAMDEAYEMGKTV